MRAFGIILLFFVSIIGKADTGIFESYVTLDSGTPKYYDCQANTPNDNFNGVIGTFTQGSTLFLKGAEIKTWKNNGSDVTGAKLYYKVYPKDTPSGNFTEINLAWGGNLGGNDQKWVESNQSINLLNNLTAGEYTIEVYFKSTTPPNEEDKIDNNNGNNYKANFIIENSNPDLVLNDGKVTVSPGKPDRTSPVKITFDANGTQLENATKVYFHSGIGSENLTSKSFNHSVGNWGKDDGIGKMASLGNNKWEITLSSIDSFYNLPQNDDAFNLNFLFRSADGSKKENNADNNYSVELESGPYFLITSPILKPYLTEVNQNFDIVAKANQSTNWTLYETDASGNNPQQITTQNGENFNFQHAVNNTEIHYYKLESNFGSVSKFKTFEVKGYVAPNQATLPQGYEKGINYNFPNQGDITLVLHTPTSTTYNFYDENNCAGTTSIGQTPAKKIIYVIGDFNNWEINENYKLNKDGDYWWITLNPSSFTEQKDEYIFQYLIDGEIRIADPYSHKVSDPSDDQISPDVYPNLIQYPYGKTTEIASVLELNPTTYQWEIPNFERKYERNDLNIYELHFRDFTPEGTYKAATEKLDYLADLGINTIHVMPVSEFEGNNSWGYNPNFYFALDKAYGTPNDLKKFIDEAHKRGIAVVNDLVLNHAFYSNPNARMYWDKENNRPATYNPWFNAEHKAIAAQGGHWGADWNHGSEHTQQMVKDILKYWVKEFKFDGFRFDFTKGFSQKAPNPNDQWASNYDVCRVEILKNVANTLWALDNSEKEHYAIYEHLANDDEDRVLANHGILLWSGKIPQEDWFKMAEGNEIKSFGKSLYTSRSFQFPNYISYIESHDEERVGFQVKNWGKGNDGTTKYLSNRLKLVGAFNLLIPGPRMVWQFGELGYDISIDQNGRTGDKPSAWELDYDKDNNRKEIYNIYSRILNFRNQYRLYDNNGFDFRNNWSTTDWVRTMSGFDNQKNVQVISIGNFDPENDHPANPGYFQTGTWFKYNGNPEVDGTPYTVNDKNEEYVLYKNDPVYVLSNADVIPPVFNNEPMTIQTDYCNYTFTENENITIGTWNAGNTESGKVADNSGNLTLKITEINGQNIELPSLVGYKANYGENIIKWEAKDGSDNVTTHTQTITIELNGECHKSAISGNTLPSDVLISTLNRNGNNMTTKQNGILVLESKSKGLVLTKIPAGENISSIQNPVNGMIVFDENDNCIKLYDGTNWACIKQKAVTNN